MTTSNRDPIGDEAVEAFLRGSVVARKIHPKAPGIVDAYVEAARGVAMWETTRAGLAAALPHLADALTASQPDRGTSDGASEGCSARSVDYSGLQGQSRPTPNPTRRVPRFCPKCGEPDPEATPTTMWCPRCTWTEER